MTRLLVPGLTCAEVFEAPRSGVLVDGRAFYKALVDACLEARRSILMAGWQFDAKVELLHGEDARRCDHPTRLVDFLRELCEARPELEVHLLAWDASAVFAFERQPLQQLVFHVRGHERIHYEMDNAHPPGASHHQKFVVIDRSIAFVGGMDVCGARWDDRAHAADAPERGCGLSASHPYHDVQAFVTGDAVDVLRTWFAERWQLATGHPLALPAPPALPRCDVTIVPSFTIDAPCAGLARTLPRPEEPPVAPVKELFELHVRAIAAAERVIYLENQYLSSDEIGDALARRMERDATPPLELVIVLPEKSAGFKERLAIGVYQQRILARLTEVAARTGHHLGVYYPSTCGEDGDVPVFIHAKVLAVDDRFLLVSSANTSNRSMGFDTELGLAWEAPAPTASLRGARIDLLAEHCGLPRGRADHLLAEPVGLVARLDALAHARSHRLRIHRRNIDEKPGWLLSKLIPDETPFDPEGPRAFVETLPEPGVWLDRLLRDPLDLFTHGSRQLRRRLGRRKARRAR